MPDYTVVSQVQRNKWVPELQQAVEGWDVTVAWGSRKQIFTVFVPDATYNPTEADTLVRQQGAVVDQVAGLGATHVSGS